MKTEKRKRPHDPGQDLQPMKRRNRARLNVSILHHSCIIRNEKHVSDCHACKQSAAGNATLHLLGFRINKDYSALSYPSTITTTGGQ